MKILLINPPNSGRSIPEEEFGITSIKLIFRGEPLALETLAGNLPDHDVIIADLKADPLCLETILENFGRPDIVGLTGVTCEANSVLALARDIKKRYKPDCPVIVVGGHHASCDPGYFNRKYIDFVVKGLGKATFASLVHHLEQKKSPDNIPGLARVGNDRQLTINAKRYSTEDLVDTMAPRYDLVAGHRDSYIMSGAGGKVGFVSTAFGCTHCCSFCTIPSLTGGRYLSHSCDSILRDIDLLGDVPLIRFVDANTFGDMAVARKLAKTLLDRGIKKRFVADVRADTVVNNPQIMQLWAKAGLVSVVIGFEEINDNRLAMLNKKSTNSTNIKALEILKELGIRVIGDFIISPDYGYEEFEALDNFINHYEIDLPVPSILTPIPGTPLHHRLKNEIAITDLDYYTFSNAVLPTKLSRKDFYTTYSTIMKKLHSHIKNS
ncbi:B12-binding domain-containing radical SAM protein [Desulfomarina sp.]